MEEPDPVTSCARDLGKGWKVRPCIVIPRGDTAVMADLKGSGAIQHIWLTVHPKWWRTLVIRMYWDDEDTPSVETPLGDFFCMGWGVRDNLSSLAVCVNPAGGFNSYWEMPFRSAARITVENIGFDDVTGFYYQVDFTETIVPDDVAYFHAQWRRVNPLPYKDVYTILEGVKGKGQYVGTYLAWGLNNNEWWGEGEIKFFMDGDGEYPTICGTGTEDYFCGAWGFVEKDEDGREHYGVFSTPYAGQHQVIEPSTLYKCQQRLGLYRWHIQDPIRFDEDLSVTIQALGWRSQGRFLPLQDDIASVAYWYQTEPHAPFPELPGRDHLEVV